VTSQPVHDRLDRHPTWMVQGVFDPEVRGQDFSYTIGLFDLGLPELHLWANPTEGGDPGEDWGFSMKDRCRILNELAFALIDGKLDVGSAVERLYDDGLVTVTFRVDPPGDREVLEAFGIAPGALVLPVSWSLCRPPAGELARMQPEAEQAMRAEYLHLLKASVVSGAPPVGWSRPVLSVDPDQDFGPRTTMVMARGAQLWSCSDLGSMLYAISPIAIDQGLTPPISVALTAARGVGRTEALARLHDQVRMLVDEVIRAAGSGWDTAVRGLAPDLESRSRRERDAVAANAADWLAQAAAAVMSVEAVADVVDRRWLLAARGPWLAGLSPRATLPGPEWCAGPGVIRAVRRLLRPLDLAAWSRINAAHDRARRRAESDYNGLCWGLTTTFQTSASGCPWSKLRDLPAGRTARHLFGRGGAWEDFVEWASCLSTLMTDRARYSHDDIETFVAPVRSVLAGLEHELNRVR
jgi:hypothetical protein